MRALQMTGSSRSLGISSLPSDVGGQHGVIVTACVSPTGAEDSARCPRSVGCFCWFICSKFGVILAPLPFVKAGDIVLCDMGCELYCYASDITNSFPAKSLPQIVPSDGYNTWKSLEMHRSVVAAMDWSQCSKVWCGWFLQFAPAMFQRCQKLCLNWDGMHHFKWAKT